MKLILNFFNWILNEQPDDFDQIDFDREYNSASRTAHIRTWEHRRDGF